MVANLQQALGRTQNYTAPGWPHGNKIKLVWTLGEARVKAGLPVKDHYGSGVADTAACLRKRFTEAYMMNLRKNRRSVLLGVAGLSLGPALIESTAKAEGAAPKGLVLGPTEGEHLIQRGGNIFINVAPTTGSGGLAMGTQQILAGVGIPIHRHFQMDEAFYVIDGSGTFILDDVRHPIQKGTSIFIPKNAWHGFENADRELLLLWIVTPPGLEAFFREVATRPGAPATPRTKEQLNEIARKYGTEFR